MKIIGFKNNCACVPEECMHLPICDKCDQEVCFCYSDNPFWDGTDAAHPAWWRGQEYGFKQALMRFNRWLDGEGLDGLDHPEVEQIKRKLLEKLESK